MKTTADTTPTTFWLRQNVTTRSTARTGQVVAVRRRLNADRQLVIKQVQVHLHPKGQTRHLPTRKGKCLWKPTAGIRRWYTPDQLAAMAG